MDFDQNRAGPRKGSVALEKIGGPPAGEVIDASPFSLVEYFPVEGNN